MSQIGDITDLIRGARPLTDGMADYHAAKRVRSGLRKRDDAERLTAVYQALKGYDVRVTYDGQGCIRLMRDDTGKKLFFPSRANA